MSSGIYKIRNKINNKLYIGSSINIELRWIRHLRQLRANNHHSKALQNAYNLYKEENFEFSIIESLNEDNSLLLREQFYLDLHQTYNPENGYNICKIAGNSSGRKPSEETKEKMRIAMKSKPRFYKRSLTESQEQEFIRLVSEGKTLKYLSNYFSCNERTLGDYCKKNNIIPNGAKKKLNFELAEKIRNEYSESPSSVKEISKKYGVELSAIYRILKNITWKK